MPGLSVEHGGNLCRDRFEQAGEVLAGAGGLRVLVEGVAGDQWQGHGGFGVDHLFPGQVNFAPAGSFLQRGAGEGAVAGVGYGDLDGVLVHGNVGVVSEQNLGGHDDVLGEVLGDAAADHQKAGDRIFQFDLGDLVEVLGGVNGDDRLAGTVVLVGDQTEASGAVGEGRAEDGYVLLIGSEDDGVDAAGGRGLAVLDQVFTHGDDELARGVGAGLERVGDDLGGLVADAELVFVDESVVDAVDGQVAEIGIVRSVLVVLGSDVVLETEGFEEVLVDDVGACGDDGVDHVVADQVNEDLLEAGGDERAGEAEDDAAVLVLEHHLVDLGGAVQVTRRVGHVCHGVDQRNDVVLLDVDVLDRGSENLFFRRHNIN